MSRPPRSPLLHAGAALSLILVAVACTGGAQSAGTSSSAPAAAASAVAPAPSSAPPTAVATSAPALATAASPETLPTVQASATPVPMDPAAAALAGTYRCLSRALYYDAGGGGTGTCPLLAQLSLGTDGRWAWETSSGTWRVRRVTAADWAAWGIQPYGGVTHVLVLNGLGQGPIEPDSGFVWVIYRDASAPGTVWLKWGRAG